jgi:hypothetical protein
MDLIEPKKGLRREQLLDSAKGRSSFAKWSKWDLVILTLPAIVLCWFVAAFSVNAPVMDQWGLPPFFADLSHGHLLWEDLWALNNEHRVLFPKILWAIMAFASRWNTQLEMCAILGSSGLTGFAIFKLAQRQKGGSDDRGYVLGLFLSSALLFSLVQYENWLWGFELAFVMVDTCVALAVLVATNENLTPLRRFGFASLFCFVASFTVAHGLFSWLALLPAVALIRKSFWPRFVDCLLWITLFGFSGLLYSIGYHREGWLPDPLFALKHPLQGLTFFLGVLGSPFGHSSGTSPEIMAVIMGAILLASFLGLTVYASINQRYRVIVPWLCLACFGLAFCVVNTVGRAGWGIRFATETSRYTTTSLLIAIAIVQILSTLAQEKPFFRAALTFSAGTIITLLLSGSVFAIERGEYLKLTRERAADVLPFIDYIDPATDGFRDGLLYPLFPVPQHTRDIRQHAHLLNAIGFRRSVNNAEFTEKSATFVGSFDEIEFAAPDNDRIHVAGWVAPRGTKTLPKVVLFSVNDEKQFFAAALVGTGPERPDIASLLHHPSFVHAGWQLDFPSELLPPGDDQVKAWVYDRPNNRFERVPEFNGPKMIHVVSSRSQ